MTRIPLAIVGNGGAAAEAVIALRGHGYAGDIHLFADNEEAPYNPMLGTYLISGAIPLEQAFPFGDKAAFYGGRRVTAHLGAGVVSLDAEERTLVTADGVDYRYDRCLVATGARPSLPPVPGLREALNGAPAERRVFTLRSLSDALALREALRRPSRDGGGLGRAAVVGASLVGVKIAALFRDLGMRVSLIEREPHLLPLVAHPDCAVVMEAALRKDGYELMLGASLCGLETLGERVRLAFGGGPEPPGAGPAPVAEDFDLVVVCTGIRPALTFLKPGCVATDAGITVDEHLCSSVPTLYAAGDVAQGMNLMSGQSEIIALWASARYQGRAAGRSLAGAPGAYRGSIPCSITHVGRMLFASVGHVRDCDEVIVSRDGTAIEVRARREGRLMGVNLLDCCLPAGAMRQALQKAAAGATTGTEATWTTFNG